MNIRYSAVCIHGDKSQYERDNVLKGIFIVLKIISSQKFKVNIELKYNIYLIDFRDSRYPILVATDVAARGLGE